KAKITLCACGVDVGLGYAVIAFDVSDERVEAGIQHFSVIDKTTMAAISVPTAVCSVRVLDGHAFRQLRIRDQMSSIVETGRIEPDRRIADPGAIGVQARPVDTASATEQQQYNQRSHS